MSLISVAIFDKEGSGRSQLTERFLQNMLETVNASRHRFFLVDNNSCLETKEILQEFKADYKGECTILENIINVGTAHAVNQGWKFRKPGECALKVDNDIEIHSVDWIEEMEEVFRRDSTIGLVGLKRRDCEERPDHPVINPDDYMKHLSDPNYDPRLHPSGLRSVLSMLPHKHGEKWVIVEEAHHVMGTCHIVRPELIERIGGYIQCGVYGWDDVLYCHRAHLAGFKTVFLPKIDLDHLYEVDVSGASDEYARWKNQEAGQSEEEKTNMWRKYESGQLPLMVEL